MDLGNNDSEMEPGALCSFLLTSPFQDANLSGCSDTRPDSRTVSALTDAPPADADTCPGLRTSRTKSRIDLLTDESYWACSTNPARLGVARAVGSRSGDVQR